MNDENEKLGQSKMMKDEDENIVSSHHVHHTFFHYDAVPCIGRLLWKNGRDKR